MFDLGWAEMAVIMLVALVVIGPKDLPKVARTIGQWTGKARALARDFQRSLDDMAREAELDEIKKTIDRVGGTNLKRAVKDFVDPDDDLERAFDVEDEASPSKAIKPSAAKSSPAKLSPGKSSPAKPSNVKKPGVASAPKALPASADPTIQPPVTSGSDEAAAVPVNAPIEKAAEAAGANQIPGSRG